MAVSLRLGRSDRKGLGIASACFAVVTLALLTGCSQSSGMRFAATGSSLSTCVQGWNSASLGEGRRSAAREATTQKQALMLAFQNGACGLIFPANKAHAAGKQRNAYVSVDGGNFSLLWSPLGLVRRSEIAKLRAAASSYTNVVVQRDTGRVVASRAHGRVPTVSARVFVSPPGGCKRVTLPDSAFVGRYKVLNTSVGCTMTRTLLWAWATERSPEHPEAKYILGWACVGTERMINFSFSPAQYRTVTCTAGTKVVEARNELQQIWEDKHGS